MFKHNFDFGSSNLIIWSEKKIKDSYLDQIFKLLQFIKYDFNRNIHNSSAYRFNAANEGANVLLTPEFVFFLKRNIEIATDSGLSPFYDNNKKTIKNIDELVEIEDNLITKNKNIYFDTKVLLQAFVVDTIFDLLAGFKLKDFLISTHNYHRSNGNRSWKVSFTLEENQEFTTKLINQAIGLNFNDNYLKPNKQATKFASLDLPIVHKFSIFKAETAIETLILASGLKKIYLKSHFENYAHQNNSSFVIYDLDDNKHIFKPIEKV